MKRTIAAATVCQPNIFLTKSQQSTTLKRHKRSDVGEHHHVADHKEWPTPGIRPRDRHLQEKCASKCASTSRGLPRGDPAVRGNVLSAFIYFFSTDGSQKQSEPP